MRILIILLTLCTPVLAISQPTEPAPSEAAIPGATDTAVPASAPASEPTTELTTNPATQATTANPLIPTGPGPEYELVDLLGGKDQLLDIQTQLVESLVSANPALDGYQQIVAEWSSRYLGWEEIREGIAKVYRDYFTPVELEEMLAFYRSPTGRKSVLLMPTLFREGSQVGMELAQAHKPELIEMLREAQQASQPAPQTGVEPQSNAEEEVAY